MPLAHPPPQAVLRVPSQPLIMWPIMSSGCVSLDSRVQLGVPNVFCRQGRGLERVRAWRLCPAFSQPLSGHFVSAFEISTLSTWKLLASGTTIPSACSVQASLVTSLQVTGQALSALAGLLGGQEALGKPSSFPLMEL